MTVIYSNVQDDDCTLLSNIWRGIDNVNVVEILPTSTDWENTVNEAIANEDDTIIFAGHGTSYGLLFPDLSRDEYILHEMNVNLIHAKNVICIFCYASDFCQRTNLHAFASSMFITNEHEAYNNGIYNYTQEQINDNSIRFHQEVNHLLKENVSLDEWVMRLGAHMDSENAIDVFNRQGLYFD